VFMDVREQENETFPQEERLLQNDYSINLPAEYYLRNKKRSSWINVINPFRSLLVLGSPGSGKSYFVIRHVITQHIKKGFTLFVYDFKFDDLSKIVYNTWLENGSKYAVEPKFFVINFDDLSRSHRCNPLDHESMTDITDAAESARTILMGLNREWIKKQGDFFVESPINFLTAIIWYLSKYKDGEFCTLPHVIELLQIDYNSLFTVLRTEKEIEVLINPFVNAYLNNATEQLEGQIASAKIAMARLSSPQLYYVLSGGYGSLDNVRHLYAPAPSWLPQWLLANNFKHNVIDEGLTLSGCAGTHCNVLPVAVFPTSFYEAITCILLFLLIWSVRKHFKYPLHLFGFYLILNGIERFFIEKIRVNYKYDWCFIHPTQAEIISAILVLAGIGIIIFYRKKISNKA